MKDVSVILPTYNEADNIELLIHEVCKRLVDFEYEIIVVDDDSPDFTWKKVKRISEDDSSIRLIHRVGEKGLASALREGIGKADGKLISWMDCDLSMPPQVIPGLIREIKDKGFDIAVGSRYVKGGGFVVVPGGEDSIMAALLSNAMNCFIRILLGSGFHDYTSGFVVARKEIFDVVELSGDYGEYFVDFIFRSMKKGYRVVEVPYICQPRLRGKSKTGDNLFDYLRRSVKYFLIVGRLLALRILRAL